MGAGERASFTAACAKLAAPFCAAKAAPAWCADMARAGSAGSAAGLSVNPHLAR
jgi:hypothetical protein